MKVLIIGAGYIGCGLAKFLSAQGHRVTLFGRRFFVQEWLRDIEYIQGDITEEKPINVLSKLPVDAIIYTISLNHHQSEENIDNAIAINVNPMRHLLDKLGDRKSHFFYLSTLQVYGIIKGAITEQTPPNPINHYGVTHLMAENLLRRSNHSKFKAINLRLSNTYGPPAHKTNDCWWLVINDLCKTSYFKGEITLQSDGSPQRNFIYNQDVYAAIDYMITNTNKLNNEIYHLAGDTSYSILGIANCVKDIYQNRYGHKITIEMPKQVEKNKKDPLLSIDISRLTEIGVNFNIDLNYGINKLYDYLEEKTA